LAWRRIRVAGGSTTLLHYQGSARSHARRLPVFPEASKDTVDNQQSPHAFERLPSFNLSQQVKKYVGEFIGTFALVFAGADSNAPADSVCGDRRRRPSAATPITMRSA
jgi:hypothetical protein